MLYKGSCKCGRWQVEVELNAALESLNPRVCDCDYCQANPSLILSAPDLSARFVSDGSREGDGEGGREGVETKQNGDQLAHFYHCTDCKVLLAVGRNIDGQLRGAVNGSLLDEANKLGKPVQIQPRLLSADEKLERWKKLWGVLRGL